MKFGLNFFPSFRPSDYSTAEYFGQCLRLAERADRLGFHSVKAVEHYFYDYGGHSPNPVVFLAAVAARTQRIRPITGAVIPAFNNPVKLAAELAVLDNLSNGRLDVGFGRAFIPKEFEVFGVSMDESRARFEEGLDIVKRLWTEDRVSYDGKFHRFRDVHLNPRPVQKPHPPIWVATVASIESFIWAGRHGYNVMIVPYVGGIEKVRGKEQVQTSLHCYVAETHAKAIDGARPRVERYIEVFGEAVGSWASHQAAQYASYGKMVDSIARTTLESMLEGHQALIGTPEEVVEQLAYQIEVFGEIEPSIQINFGGSGDDEALRTLELFAGRVMPRFTT
jgi:alkanesulfonate monooxygenase SsuD/methylene tetrahydromethanopterin reductase-like flavin-dependent oxidoreductase (luciferase family)